MYGQYSVFTVLEMITDLEVRKRWDTQFPVIEVLEEHKHYKVVYWLVPIDH